MISLKKKEEQGLEEKFNLPSYTPKHLIKEEDTIKKNEQVIDKNSKQNCNISKHIPNENIQCKVEVVKKKMQKVSKEESRKIAENLAGAVWIELLKKADEKVLSYFFYDISSYLISVGYSLKDYKISITDADIRLTNVHKDFATARSYNASAYLKILIILFDETSTLDDLMTCIEKEMQHYEKIRWLSSLRTLCIKLKEGNTSLNDSDFEIIDGRVSRKWLKEFYSVVYPRLYNLILREQINGDIEISDKQWIQLLSYSELMLKGKMPKNKGCPINFYKILVKTNNIQEKLKMNYFMYIGLSLGIIGVIGLVTALRLGNIDGVIAASIWTIFMIFCAITDGIVDKKRELEYRGKINDEMLELCTKPSFIAIMKTLY